jgi:hypothetical protein
MRQSQLENLRTSPKFVIPAAPNSRKAGQAGLSTAKLIIHFEPVFQNRRRSWMTSLAVESATFTAMTT